MDVNKYPKNSNRSKIFNRLSGFSGIMKEKVENRESERQTDRETERQRDRETERQTERQTDRKTD